MQKIKLWVLNNIRELVDREAAAMGYVPKAELVKAKRIAETYKQERDILRIENGEFMRQRRTKNNRPARSDISVDDLTIMQRNIEGVPKALSIPVVMVIRDNEALDILEYGPGSIELLEFLDRANSFLEAEILAAIEEHWR